jgi:hypothetical protein
MVMPWLNQQTLFTISRDPRRLSSAAVPRPVIQNGWEKNNDDLFSSGKHRLRRRVSCVVRG